MKHFVPYIRGLMTPVRMRFIKFGVVGALGVLVNELLLWFAYEHLLVFAFGDGMDGDTRLAWAGVTAIGVSIFTNFLLNDIWTWNDRPKGRGARAWLVRLGKYYAVATVAGIIQWTVLQVLTRAFGVVYLVSNLLGIIAGLFINFFVNNVWTFRDSGSGSPGPGSPGPNTS